jgi:hypothetical protein
MYQTPAVQADVAVTVPCVAGIPPVVGMTLKPAVLVVTVDEVEVIDRDS